MVQVRGFVFLMDLQLEVNELREAEDLELHDQTLSFEKLNHRV